MIRRISLALMLGTALLVSAAVAQAHSGGFEAPSYTVQVDTLTFTWSGSQVVIDSQATAKLDFVEHYLRPYETVSYSFKLGMTTQTYDIVQRCHTLRFTPDPGGCYYDWGRGTGGPTRRWRDPAALDVSFTATADASGTVRAERSFSFPVTFRSRVITQWRTWSPSLVDTSHGYHVGFYPATWYIGSCDGVGTSMIQPTSPCPASWYGRRGFRDYVWGNDYSLEPPRFHDD